LSALSVDATIAKRLQENANIGYQGDTKGGPFEISAEAADRFLSMPSNPNGHPNSDVVRLWITGHDVTRRPQNELIIDFGVNMNESDAALYEAPFEHVRRKVMPIRVGNAVARTAANWWIHRRPVPLMRKQLRELDRCLATTRHANQRLFVWIPATAIPDSALIVFMRQDDYFFGVLHSRAHEVWSLRMGTWLGVGNDPRYTPTTCFETFPLPWPPGQEPWRDPRAHTIANAAHALDEARRAWLDLPESTPDVPKKRTLTNPYNERPTWLARLHADLDRAVWEAYGWDDSGPSATSEDVILGRLLALNRERASRS
jgi:hypothetical protein